jgi:hypothetical protein
LQCKSIGPSSSLEYVENSFMLRLTLVAASIASALIHERLVHSKVAINILTQQNFLFFKYSMHRRAHAPTPLPQSSPNATGWLHVGTGTSHHISWPLFRLEKNFKLINSTTFVLFDKYCPIVYQLGSKDSSRDFQLNCVISYFFYLYLVLHASG